MTNLTISSAKNGVCKISAILLHRYTLLSECHMMKYLTQSKVLNLFGQYLNKKGRAS